MPCRVIDTISIVLFVFPLVACRTASPVGPNDEGLRRLEDEFLQVDVDSAPDRKKAAEQFLQVAAERRRADTVPVGERSLEYEKALLKAGHCYRLCAVQKWTNQHANADTEQEVKHALRLAEEALQQVLMILEDPARRSAEADIAQTQSNLWWIGTFELAYVYLHEASQKYGDCLILLDKGARALPTGNARLAKVWALEIHVRISQKQPDLAANTLDLMFDQFPDAPELARACKKVAMALDEATRELVKAKAEQARINENLRRISRYYAKWLVAAPGLNMRITMADVLAVAETLYEGANQINGLGENVISFLDLKGRKITEANYFRDAVLVHKVLTEGKVGTLSDRDRIIVMTRLARCYSFIAQDTEGWGKARDQYEHIMRVYKAVAASGRLDDTVLQAHPNLLGVYVELGYVYYELGQKGSKAHLGSASLVFGNVLGVVPGAPESLWKVAFEVLQMLVETGVAKETKMAKVGLENLERGNPDFDHDQFGMKAKFLELKKTIAGRSRDD
jgi:tetratricopeptide (TPR) repeat protein